MRGADGSRVMASESPSLWRCASKLPGEAAEALENKHFVLFNAFSLVNHIAKVNEVTSMTFSGVLDGSFPKL